MPLDRITGVLKDHVADLEEKGTAKGAESVVTKVFRPEGVQDGSARFRQIAAGRRRLRPGEQRDRTGGQRVRRHAVDVAGLELAFAAAPCR